MSLKPTTSQPTLVAGVELDGRYQLRQLLTSSGNYTLWQAEERDRRLLQIVFVRRNATNQEVGEAALRLRFAKACGRPEVTDWWLWQAGGEYLGYAVLVPTTERWVAATIAALRDPAAVDEAKPDEAKPDEAQGDLGLKVEAQPRPRRWWAKLLHALRPDLLMAPAGKLVWKQSSRLTNFSLRYPVILVCSLLVASGYWLWTSWLDNLTIRPTHAWVDVFYWLRHLARIVGGVGGSTFLFALVYYRVLPTKESVARARQLLYWGGGSMIVALLFAVVVWLF